MYKLVIQDDEGKTTVVPLIRDEITIGRKEGNTIRLTERNVSRQHARIVRTNGSITIEDLDSYNGIKVNGAKIEGRATVSEADRVQIGDYLIEVRVEGQDSIDTVADDAETRPMPAATQPLPKVEGVDPVAATPVPDVPTKPMPAAAAPAASTAPATPPRLVILSSNFAGQEWNLDKNRLVVGRTDENDIWINHRSISRHHAELVEEAGRWSIVDLQSSNGVRVNGEDYGKVELRRGDIIDLGHVRMRFVDAGEDFVFGRDAQAVDIASEGGGRSLGLILLVALLIGGGAAAFAMFGRGDDKPVAATDARAPVVTRPSDSPTAKPADAAPETATGEVADLVRRAQTALDAESWVEAEGLAKEALAVEADHEPAKAIEDKAVLEKASLVFFDEFRSASNGAKPDYEQAVALYNKIADESVYKDRARADYDRLKTQYIQRVVASAEETAAKGRCAEVRKMAVTAGKVFADAEAAVRAVRCTAGGTQVTNNTPKPDPTPDPTPQAPLNIEETINKARTAAMRNQWGAARNACEEVLKVQPNNVDARSICLLAACSLKRQSLAEKHYEKLPPSRKGWAVQQCFNQGVQIGP